MKFFQHEIWGQLTWSWPAYMGHSLCYFSSSFVLTNKATKHTKVQCLISTYTSLSSPSTSVHTLYYIFLVELRFDVLACCKAYARFFSWFPSTRVPFKVSPKYHWYIFHSCHCALLRTQRFLSATFRTDK